MTRGRARGHNLEHLRFFFSCIKLFIFEQQVLLRVDSVTSYLKAKCPGVGQVVKI